MSNVKTTVFGLFTLLCSGLILPAAHAGPYTDDLSTCLVQSSTADDKLTLVQWMFASMALHPAVADVATVSDSRRQEANQAMAELLENLLEQRCLTQARDAIEHEGALALQTSFAMLGQVAAGSLFSHPDVASGLADLSQFLDSEDIERKLGIGGN